MGWHGPRRGETRTAYQSLRRQVIADAHGRCEIRLPGVCTGDATTLDHIRAIAEGGAVLDRRNCRAACRPCNTRLGAQLGGRRLNVKNQRWSRAW